MSTIRADVIVVGAGPAGVAAAIDLMRAGTRVVLIEKDDFPREKPCAGGVSISSLQRLRYDIGPVTRVSVNKLQLSLRQQGKVFVSSGATLIAMTRRAEFDSWGIKAAVDEGAQLIVADGLVRLTQSDDDVTIEYPGLKVKGKYLIAADGAGSLIRRLVYGGKPESQAVAVEACIDANDVAIAPEIPTMIDFGVAKGGYGWVFPKGDHFNIGLYTYSQRMARGINRKQLVRYAASVLGTEKLAEVRGFPIATACSGGRVSKGRVLFVGDAGGFSYAISGEGIYGAILTGQIAALSILRADDPGRDYRDRIRPYLRKCSLNRMMAMPFYGGLPFSYPVLSRRMISLAASVGNVD